MTLYSKLQNKDLWQQQQQQMLEDNIQNTKFNLCIVRPNVNKEIAALINKSYVKSHIECTGISNCKLFDDANLCTSSWRASLLTSILVATFERAERYTTTHATSVANSSSLNSTSKYCFKLGYKFYKKLNEIISRNENYSPDQREERW